MAEPFVSENKRVETSLVSTCCITNMATQNTVDLRNIIRGITIFNSLDVMLASGWIDVMDQGNLIEQYQLNGQEFVDLKLQLGGDTASGSSTASPNFNEYRRRFFVYAIENIYAVKDQMFYRIKFIDPFALMNTDTRISWHFKNMKGEDIIKKLQGVAENKVNEPYSKALEMDVCGGQVKSPNKKLFDFSADASTQFDFDIYVPMMKPLELIRYIADRVVSSGDNPCAWSDCLFYQDKEGKFHLDSFRNLFKKGSPIVLTQQIAENMTSEKEHLIESYTFNKIYNLQVDKLNGIYGVHFAIADFKPSTKKTTEQTILGTNIVANSGADKATDSLSLRSTIDSYFGHSLGPFSNLTSKSSGFIVPWQCDERNPPLTSIQTTGENGQQKQVSYKNKAGALIFMDTCGIIHEDDNTYNEYKRVTLPYVNGCIMKKVLSTYVINVVMNGAFDIDVGKTFKIKLDETTGPQQMAVFVGDVIWLVSDVRHEWRSDVMQVKTYVTAFTPFLKKTETPGTAKQ